MIWRGDMIPEDATYSRIIEIEQIQDVVIITFLHDTTGTKSRRLLTKR